MMKLYYKLTKPGIIMGNLITAVAGFALASKGHIEIKLLLTMLLGLSCIIASACVFNNYIDRHSDAKMERTKNRPLVKGLIAPRNALIFGTVLGLLGTLILVLYTNPLTLFIALTGFFVYVILYSFGKYFSSYGTLIGSIAGAVPPLVGYCAVSGRFDLGGLVLFMIVALWQMPHFYAIALYRLDDYTAAGIPVLPIKKGLQTTKVHMLWYVMAFTAAALMLVALGYTGYAYLTVTVSLSLIWLWLAIKGLKTDQNPLWARQMFRFSLVMILALSVVITLDAV